MSTYTGNVLSGLTSSSIAPILDDKGKPPPGKLWGDAEAIAAGPGGKTIVGFESRTRVGAYDLARKGIRARFQNLNPPKEIAKGPRNGELESIGYFGTGALAGNYLAVAESNFDTQGSTKAWVWNGKRSIAFSIRQLENYEITDVAILPNGDVLILQRSYSLTTLPGMAIEPVSARDIEQGKTVAPATLWRCEIPSTPSTIWKALRCANGTASFASIFFQTTISRPKCRELFCCNLPTPHERHSPYPD